MRADAVFAADPADWRVRVLRTWCRTWSGCAGDDALTFVSLGQNIYTQAVRSRAVPLAGDHPIGGWLYLRTGATLESDDRLDALSVEVGLTGPAALGEEAQNTMHSELHVGRVPGWPYQLRPRAGVALQAASTRRSRLGANADLLLHAAVDLGTLRSDARVGALLRAGPALRGARFAGEARDTIPARVLPGRWWVHAGAALRVVAFDGLVEGPAYGYSPRVDARPWVAEAFAGIGLRLGRRATLGFLLSRRTLDFESAAFPSSRASPQSIGAIRLDWSFE